MLLWKLLEWLSNAACTPEGEIDDFMKKVVIFNCFSSSVCPYIHSCIVPWYLHLVLTFQAPLHEMVNFKVITKWYTIWRPFFRALLVSWSFSTAASEYSSPGLLSSVNVSCASKFTQQHKIQELSGCQPSPSLGTGLELNKPTQRCSISHYADWWISRSHLLISAKASSSTQSELCTSGCPKTS